MLDFYKAKGLRASFQGLHEAVDATRKKTS
jgi:hypothetical protein